MAERLFKSLQIGDALLEHRIVMAPLTRFRANKQHDPSPFAKEYYGQRASVPGTLLITEATFISPEAGGFPHAPGIFSLTQIAAWKDIVDAVHEKGSFIYLQLWALGRAAKADVLKEEGDYRVRGPSAIAMSGKVQGKEGLSESVAVPDAMTEEEIQQFIHGYAQAAKNAMRAGFDGVEIHGANGYLIDQFWQDISNQRTDTWGGCIENRARFGLEVAKACIDAVGSSKKVAMRLSPFGDHNEMGMGDRTIDNFTYITNELRKLDIAYIHFHESRVSGGVVDAVFHTTTGALELEPFIEACGSELPVIIAGGYTAAKARKIVGKIYTGDNIAVAFGRYFISTPDLPFRLQYDIELNPYERKTFYTQGHEGYTDYPFSKEFLAQERRL